MCWVGRLRSLIQRALVFPCAAVLRKLNDKQREDGEQNHMPHSTFMEQKRSRQPNDEQQTSSDPEHTNSSVYQICFVDIVRLSEGLVESRPSGTRLLAIHYARVRSR